MSKLIDPPEVTDTTSIHTYRTESNGQELVLARTGLLVDVCAPSGEGNEIWTKTAYRARDCALDAYHKALERLYPNYRSEHCGYALAHRGRVATMRLPEKEGALFLVEWVCLATDTQCAWLTNDPDEARTRFAALDRLAKEGGDDLAKAFMPGQSMRANRKHEVSA